MVDTPGYRVFVGGISWKADELQLENFFSTHGQVLECKIIMDKNTGKSKGYGFVTFKDAGAAEFVKQTANFNFLGKNMNVGDAVRKVAEPNGSNSSTNSSGARSIPNSYNGSNGYHQPYYNQNYYSRSNDTQFYGQYSPDGTYYPAPYYYQQQGFRGSPQGYQYGYQAPSSWNGEQEPTSQESSPGTSPSYQYPYSPPGVNPYYTNGNYYNPYYYQYSNSYPGYGYNGNFAGDLGEDGSGNHGEQAQHNQHTPNGEHDSVYINSNDSTSSSNFHPSSTDSTSSTTPPSDASASTASTGASSTASDQAVKQSELLQKSEQPPYPGHQATQPRQIPKAYNGGQYKGAPRAAPKNNQRPPQQSQSKPNKQKSHRPPHSAQDPSLRNVIPSFNKLSVSSN